MGTTGRRYYNNGEVSRIFRDGEMIPEGFVLGGLPMSEETKRARLEKSKKTCLRKYGVENPSQSEEIKKKKEETSLKHFGVRNVGQSSEVRERAKKTNLERYGVEFPLQSENLKEKLRNTCLERYGTDSVLKDEGVREKIASTNVIKFGGRAPLCSEEVREKLRRTCLERYGVEHPNKDRDIRKRAEDTCMERYGVKNPSQDSKVKEKKRLSLQRHYGVDSPLRSEVIKDKVAETLQNRYGVTNLSQSPEFRERIKETCLEKYGVMWPCQIDTVRRSSRGRNSVPNEKFENKLIQEGINYQREYGIEDREYDFKVGNTLIEINPYATHNTVWSPFKKEGGSVEEDYHYNKSHIAESHGFRCIHIFDWDDVDKVVDSLKGRETVYARKCEVREVDKDECREYLQRYHLQGSCRGQEIRLGLYYNNDLVSIMTFGKPRYNKNYDYELLRYCSSSNVIGGAEKLFKSFTDNHSGSIISYCDRAKFTGSVYHKLGFTLLTTGKPACHWYGVRSGKHYTDSLIRQRGVDQILKTNYGKGTDNRELMLLEGYVPIYDCGQDTYVYGGTKIGS